MPQVSYSRLFLLAMLAVSVFFVELGAARLWDRDEPRNARASHEMLDRGDWIVPTFNGVLRDHKPILLYWGQMLSYQVLGESEFTARLPSALCALLTVLTVAILASRLSNKPSGISPEGFWAAGCLGTSLLFVMAGRAATPDACLIAFSTLGIAALVLGSLAPSGPYSSGQVAMARWLPAMFGYTMLGLAVLAKGPVGIILPLAVVHAWWMICHRLQTHQREPTLEKSSVVEQIQTQMIEIWLTFHPLQCLRAIGALRAVPGVFLSLVVAAPWYIAVGLETNGAFLKGFFLEHNVGRALGSMEGHGGSILFYPLAFVVGVFPWSLWLIPIGLWCRDACGKNVVHRQLVVLSAVWICVYLSAFSMASTKLPSYITPCYAGAALAIGGYWREFENAWSRPSLTLRYAAYGLTVIVGLAIAGALLWLSDNESMPLLARAAACGIVIAVIGGLGFVWERTTKTAWVPATWLVGAAAFQLILFGYGAKTVDGYRQDLAALSHVKQRDHAVHWLAIGGLEPSWVHYLGMPIVEVTNDANDVRTWKQVADFLKQHPDGRVLVVGETMHEKMLNWQDAQELQLIELATAPRFLRPGMMRVFGRVVEMDRISPGQLTRTANSAEYPNSLRPKSK